MNDQRPRSGDQPDPSGRALVERRSHSGPRDLYVVGPNAWVRHAARPLSFGILGPLEAGDGDRALDLGPPKQRAVLAVLLLDANSVVSTDALVDRLWGEAPPDRAVGALQAYIHNLRSILEPGRPARAPSTRLESKACGYVLHVDATRYDAARFERLVHDGQDLLREGCPGAARSVLGEALALWRGPALADFVYERFAQSEIARLNELRAVALEDRVVADLALGDHVALLAELEALTSYSPLREGLRAAQMIALYRSGRQADALRTYRRYREVIVDELGIEPSPVLRRLERLVLAQDPGLDWRVHADREPVRPLISWLAGEAS